MDHWITPGFLVPTGDLTIVNPDMDRRIEE
jgi:hypothetical protein